MKTKFLNLKSLKFKIIILIVFLLGLYWVKNQFSIEFFKDFSLSAYFPFSLLKNDLDIIEADKTGLLIDETFNSVLDKVDWDILWAAQEDSVEMHFESAGSTTFITIINNGSANWALSSMGLIETDVGDSIKIIVTVKKSDKKIKTGISLSTFDQDKNVIEWNTNQGYLKAAGQWETLEKDFTIAQGVYYIRLRLAGNGHGSVSFNDVKLFREKKI